MRTLVLIMIISHLLSAYCYAGNIKEEYELQEKCGKRAAEIFKNEYGNGVDVAFGNTTLSKFTNHYNAKLNKCFILITTSITLNGKKTTKLYSEILYDINDNKDYGSIFKYGSEAKPDYCQVLDNVCESEKEWNIIIKPFMEQ